MNRIFYAINDKKFYSGEKQIGILNLCQWLCNFLEQFWKISTFSFTKLGVSQTNRETTCYMGIWLEMVIMIMTDDRIVMMLILIRKYNGTGKPFFAKVKQSAPREKDKLILHLIRKGINCKCEFNNRNSAFYHITVQLK